MYVSRGTQWQQRNEPPKRVGAGLYVYAVGSIATGILNAAWGGFEAAHQPIQAFGDNIPGREVLAYISALWLIVGGAAILWRRTVQKGAIALAAIYLIFALFWLPRFYTAPHALGLRVSLIIGLLVGVAQQLILVAAALTVYFSFQADDSPWRSKALLMVRWTLGLSSVDFGLAHLTAVEGVAAMVPGWMPFGGSFWTILTGIAFVLGGLAILSRVLEAPAARLLAAMLFIFSAFVLVPRALSHAPDHVAWGSNAYNLAAIGAFWLFADSIARFSRKQAAEARAEMDIARRPD